MPEVQISVGNRVFEVACQPGEEPFLQAAAQMLDAEAQTLLGAIGRLPDTRLLLMSGLMLADRTAGLEDQLRAASARAEAAERRLAEREANPQTVEVPVIPAQVSDTLAEIAARAEALAARLDEVE